MPTVVKIRFFLVSARSKRSRAIGDKCDSDTKVSFLVTMQDMLIDCRTGSYNESPPTSDLCKRLKMKRL